MGLIALRFVPAILLPAGFGALRCIIPFAFTFSHRPEVEVQVTLVGGSLTHCQLAR